MRALSQEVVRSLTFKLMATEGSNRARLSLFTTAHADFLAIFGEVGRLIPVLSATIRLGLSIPQLLSTTGPPLKEMLDGSMALSLTCSKVLISFARSLADQDFVKMLCADYASRRENGNGDLHFSVPELLRVLVPITVR